MSFIANTAFETRVTNGRFDDLQNITGRYQASSADADCSAGLLCVRNGVLPVDGFTGVYNENAWYMNAAASTVTADDVIYAANTYDWQLLSDASGNLYSVGHNTLGLGIPAGRNGTFTRIDFDGQHRYRFGIGNLSAAISTNTYFTIANGLLVPAASAPSTAGSVYFELVGTGTFTEGTTAGATYYDVIAKKVTA